MRYIRKYNQAPRTVKWKYFDPTRRIDPSTSVVPSTSGLELNCAILQGLLRASSARAHLIPGPSLFLAALV
jgi:hypothetical protein